MLEHAGSIHNMCDMCDAPGDCWEVSMAEPIGPQCAVLNSSMKEGYGYIGELPVTKFAKWLPGYHMKPC